MSSNNQHTSIFHAYDIRGIVNEQLTEETFYLIGAGIAQLTKKRSDIRSPIVVGRDGRTTSEVFAQATIDALTDRGIDVIDIGLCTTPMLYFAVQHYKAGGGAMITASHNPKEYNGLKLVNKDSTNLSPLQEALFIKEFCEANTLATISVTPEKKRGTLTEKQIITEYVAFMLPKIETIENLHIVFDAGSGVGAIPSLAIAENLDVTVTPLFCDIDGNFPHHEANPSKYETLQTLQNTVVQKNADFGVAFDGDADRVGFVDEKGNVVPSDIIGCLLADYYLEKHKGRRIVHDLLCTKELSAIIQKNNAQETTTKVGRHNVTQVMREQKDAIFGVEKSGHYFFNEFFGVDNAMLPWMHVAQILTLQQRPLSELVNKYKTFASSPIVTLNVSDRDQAILAIKNEFKDAKISELDGVTITTDQVWFTVRKSNTEPVIRISAESKFQEILNQTLERIKTIVHQA